MANKYLTLLENISQAIAQNRRVKQIMTIEDVSQFTGFSKSYIYRLCSQRVMPHYKPAGKKLFFKRRELEQFLLSNHYPSIDMLRPNQKFENK